MDEISYGSRSKCQQHQQALYLLRGLGSAKSTSRPYVSYVVASVMRPLVSQEDRWREEREKAARQPPQAPEPRGPMPSWRGEKPTPAWKARAPEGPPEVPRPPAPPAALAALAKLGPPPHICGDAQGEAVALPKQRPKGDTASNDAATAPAEAAPSIGSVATAAASQVGGAQLSGVGEPSVLCGRRHQVSAPCATPPRSSSGIGAAPRGGGGPKGGGERKGFDGGKQYSAVDGGDGKCSAGGSAAGSVSPLGLGASAIPV